MFTIGKIGTKVQSDLGTHFEKVALTALAGVDKARVRHLAHLMRRPIVASDSTQYPFLLIDDGSKLGMLCTNLPKQRPVVVDFASVAIQKECAQRSARRDPLARALGLDKRKDLTIVDATAGLARESFLLAHWGAQVTLIERAKPLCLLIDDGLQRLAVHSVQRALCERLTLIEGDSLAYLSEQNADEKPDCIYLDPMFPARRKSALVKKNMQLLQNLLPPIDEATITQMINTSLAHARMRVVLKRPRHAPIAAPRRLAYTIASKMVRYEIYQP